MDNYNLSSCRRALYNHLADTLPTQHDIASEDVAEAIAAFESGASESGKQYAVIVTLRN